MICEGPIFGNVATGGDPNKTQFVVWNLACLPFGVFAATEIGSWIGGHNGRKTDEPSRASVLSKDS